MKSKSSVVSILVVATGVLFAAQSLRAETPAYLDGKQPLETRVEDLLERYDILAMLLASVLPPPFPFKLFVLSAGAFKMQLWRFVAALVVGRGFRFLLEGILAVKYGEQATDIFKHNYPKIGLGVAAAILVIYLFNSLLKRRRREATS